MTPVPTSRPRRVLAGLAVVAIALGVTACGDDDGADGALASYCEDSATADALFKLADMEDTEAFEEFLVDARTVIDRIGDEAPEEIAEPLGVMEAAFQEVEAGDPEAFFADDVSAADDEVHAFDLEHCGWERVDVTAEDYHFTADLPDEPGTVSFEVANQGDEAHVMIVVRKLDSVDGPALDAFEALEAEEDLPGSFDVVTQAFAVPGDSEYAVADLTEGEYLLFCPIPVGSTVGEEGPQEGDGPPHFTEGMVTAFTVSG